MPKAKSSLSGQAPWHCKVEDQLRDRPGVLWIYLLTDEAGAAWIARGEVPQYMREQALDALQWNATIERARVEIDPADDGAAAQPGLTLTLADDVIPGAGSDPEGS